MENEPHYQQENAIRILEEGWRLFQQQGYRGVTVDELCACCQLTKPTLYYYFHDKETLFVAVLQHKLRGFRVAAEQPGTLAERLTAVASAILNSFQTEYTMLLRDRKHLKQPENLQKIRNAFRSELFDPLTALMQTGIIQGELQEDHPELLTLLFLGMINNLIGKSTEFNQPNAALAQKVTHYFLAGATKSSQPNF